MSVFLPCRLDLLVEVGRQIQEPDALRRVPAGLDPRARKRERAERHFLAWHAADSRVLFQTIQHARDLISTG